MTERSFGGNCSDVGSVGWHACEGGRQFVRCRKPRMNSRLAGITAASPWIGSSITATVSSSMARGYSIQIVVGDLDKSRCFWFEQPIPAGFARCGHGRQSPAMKAILKGNDFIGTPAMACTPLARQLDCTFIGLRAAVGEEHLIEDTVLHQPASAALYPQINSYLHSDPADTPRISSGVWHIPSTLSDALEGGLSYAPGSHPERRQAVRPRPVA
jgi:hypothetical protein